MKLVLQTWICSLIICSLLYSSQKNQKSLIPLFPTFENSDYDEYQDFFKTSFAHLLYSDAIEDLSFFYHQTNARMRALELEKEYQESDQNQFGKDFEIDALIRVLQRHSAAVQYRIEVVLQAKILE